MAHPQLEKALHSVPFLNALGVRVERARPGMVVLRVPCEDKTTNFDGVVHNGAVFSLGELAAGVALATHPNLVDVEPLAKGSRIKYLRTSRKDVTAHAEITAEVVELVRNGLDVAGHAQVEIPVHIMDGHGNDVAELHAIFGFRYR